MRDSTIVRLLRKEVIMAWMAPSDSDIVTRSVGVLQI